MSKDWQFLFKNKLPRILNDVLCTGTILFLQYQRNYQACCWRFGGEDISIFILKLDSEPLRVAPFEIFFLLIKVLKASLIILLWKHKTSSLALNLVGSQENCWSVLWLCLLWKIYYMWVQGERPLGSKNKRSIKEALT